MYADALKMGWKEPVDLEDWDKLNAERDEMKKNKNNTTRIHYFFDIDIYNDNGVPYKWNTGTVDTDDLNPSNTLRLLIENIMK